MGRRGQAETEPSGVNPDALPALSGRRRDSAVMSGRESGKQGGTAGYVFPVLVPHRGTGTFFIHKREVTAYAESR